MAEIKNKKSNMLCGIAILIIFASYVAERMFEIFANPTETSSLIAAIIFTLLLGVAYFVNAKIDDPFYAMLAAMVGFKMMPPVVYPLYNFCPEGNLIYTVVRAVGATLFALLIIKIYRKQPKENAIAVVPVVILMFVVPFFNELGADLSIQLFAILGTKLYGYFTEIACYALAAIIIFVCGYKNNYQTAKFVSYFQIVALSLNIIRRGAAVAVNLIAGTHISRSYYLWIAVYVVLMVAFIWLRKYKENANNT